MTVLSTRLDGRHALVCGASAGIGAAAARALARAGASVSVLARREPELRAVVRSFPGDRGHVVVADLDDTEGLRARIRELLEVRGPVHVLVHNVAGPPGGPLLDAGEDALLTAMRRHLLSAQALAQLCVPGMAAAGFGRLIQVISTSVREPIDGLGVSNTVRGAMASWAKSLSRELPPGVTINNVLPGFTRTERLASLAQARATAAGSDPDAIVQAWLQQVPEGRLVEPEETAATIAFLASPAAAAIRGQSIAVDGGRLRGI